MGLQRLRNDGIIFDWDGTPVALSSGADAPSGDRSGEDVTVQAFLRNNAPNADSVLYVSTDAGVSWSAVQGSVANERPTNVIADPGHASPISVARSGVCSLVSVGAGETRSLAAPSFLGQRIVLIHDTAGGDIEITASAAFNQAGNTVMTFAQAEDFIELVAATIGGLLRWRISANNGVALS